MEDFLVTACIRRMGKVLFSQVSVCSYLGGSHLPANRGIPTFQTMGGVPTFQLMRAGGTYLLAIREEGTYLPANRGIPTFQSIR